MITNQQGWLHGAGWNFKGLDKYRSDNYGQYYRNNESLGVFLKNCALRLFFLNGKVSGLSHLLDHPVWWSQLKSKYG
jgi:hypothetical protein